MHSKIKNVIESMEKNKMKKKKVSYKIGVEIKRQRTRLKQTLTEVCKGICSISYLSKLENDQINGNVNYLNDLMDRVNINPTMLYTTESYPSYLQAIAQAYFYQDNTVIEQILVKIEGRRDYQSDIVRIVALIAVNRYKDSNINDTMFPLTDSLDELELLYLSLFLSIHHSNINRYKEAYKLVSLISEDSLFCNVLRAIYYNQLLLTCIKMHQHIHIHAAYEKMEFHCAKLHQVARLKENKMLYYNYLASRSTLFEVKILLKNSPELDMDTKRSIMWRSQLASGATVKVMKEIEMHIIKGANHQTKLLLVQCYNLLGEKDKLLALLDQFKDFEGDTQELLFIDYMQKKYTLSNFELTNYIKNYVYDFVHSLNDVNPILFYTNELVTLLTRESRYKEVTKVYNRAISKFGVGHLVTTPY